MSNITKFRRPIHLSTPDAARSDVSSDAAIWGLACGAPRGGSLYAMALVDVTCRKCLGRAQVLGLRSDEAQ